MFSVNFIVEPTRILEHWSAVHNNKPAPADLFSQAERFYDEVKIEWQKNETAYISKLSEVSGLNITGEFTVFILPPILEEAQYLNENEIEWGQSALFPNFISRGLCHEILHCLTHEFYQALSDDQKWVFHALVYLAVDEEFYRHFHNSSSYFSSSIINSFYHPRLIDTAKLLLPQWIDFTKKRSDLTIYDLYRNLSAHSKTHITN